MPPAVLTHDVFISYTKADADIAELIERGLTDAGLKVWCAPKSIREGEQWMDAINAGLAGSKVLLVLYSPDPFASPWVAAESNAGMQQRLRRDSPYEVIPVLVRGAQTADLPPLVQNIQGFEFQNVDFDQPKQAHDAVDRVARRLLGEPPPDDQLAVPIVVYAMTRQEAELLGNRKILDDPMAPPFHRQIFENLAGSLDYKVEEIPLSYRELRDEWTPPLAGGLNIKQSIEQVISNFNRRRLELRDRPPALYAQSYSTDLLSDDQALAYKTGRALQTTGCVLIIDTLSLFHPGLRQKLDDSGLVTSPENVSIVVLAPRRRVEVPISEVLERDISRMIKRAFDRFREFDRLCEFGVVNSLALNRWLFHTLPDVATAAMRQRPHSAARRAVGKLSPGPDASSLFGRRPV